MIFCSVVMVSSNAPRRDASPPRPLRAPPRLAIRRGDRTPLSDKFWLMHFTAPAFLRVAVAYPCTLGTPHIRGWLRGQPDRVTIQNLLSLNLLLDEFACQCDARTPSDIRSRAGSIKGDS